MTFMVLEYQVANCLCFLIRTELVVIEAHTYSSQTVLTKTLPKT